MHMHQKNSKELYININLVCLSIAVKNGKCYHFIISSQIVLFYLLFFLSSARSCFCCAVLSSYICLRIENKPEVSYVKISLICNVVEYSTPSEDFTFISWTVIMYESTELISTLDRTRLPVHFKDAINWYICDTGCCSRFSCK